MELQKPNKLKPEQQTQLCPHKTGTFRFFASTMYAGKRRFNACARGNKSVAGLLHFCTLFRGSAIGSTPAFGAGYPGSSPGPGAICFVPRTEPAGSFYSRAENFLKEMRRSLGCRNPARLGWGHNFQFGGTLCFEMLFAAMQEPFKFLFRADRNSR